MGAATAALMLLSAAVHAADQRAELLVRGETELQRGENAAALDDFERAAMMRHEADAEIGLIRAALQDGQYRRALAFAAHTAGEHLDHTEAGALYSWLLYVGGQRDLALRLLGEWQARAPDDPVLAETARALASDLPEARGVLLQAPQRFAPWPSGTVSPPADAGFASNGVLIGDGSLAVVPALDADQVWVRNGRGQTSPARVDRSDAALQASGLVLLHLQAPLPPGPASSVREPFAGSPGFALQFAPGAEAAWPMLSQGFLGSQSGALRRLGFALGQRAQGAAVLDREGRLAGIVVADGEGGPRWLPATGWPGGAGEPSQANVARGLIAPDQVYEAGLRVALQVLAVPR